MMDISVERKSGHTRSILKAEGVVEFFELSENVTRVSTPEVVVKPVDDEGVMEYVSLDGVVSDLRAGFEELGFGNAEVVVEDGAGGEDVIVVR